MGDLLRDDVIERAIAGMTPTPAAHRPAPTREINPTVLGILSALADGASTAHLLTRGGVEDNALYRPMKGHPAATGLAVAGSGLAEVGLAKLLGKKFPGLAKAIGAQTTATRIGVAAENFARPNWRDNGGSSVDAYRRKVAAALRQER